jgi:hypothetical protein
VVCSWDARWAPAREQLSSLALVGQTVQVLTHHVQFDECELCVAAYTHSLRSHTSNVMHSGGLRTQVHRYLDSAALRDWLEHFEQKFWGIREDAKREQATDPNTGERYALPCPALPCAVLCCAVAALCLTRRRFWLVLHHATARVCAQ